MSTRRTILTADALITVDDTRSIRYGDAVLVDGTTIVAVAPAAELTAAHPDAELLDGSGGVLLPGWINTHTHLAMNVFRGLTDDVTLEEFLERLIAAEFAAMSEEMVEAGTRAAIAELIQGGVTTALDMYYYAQASARVADEAGFRLLNGPTFLGDADPDGRSFADALAAADDECARVVAGGGTPWIMPHSTYTLSAPQLAAIADVARRHGARVNTHCAESPGEMAQVRDQHNARPLRVLDEAGLLSDRTVLAHMVHTTADELPLLAERGVAVAHCPASNLKLGCGVAPVSDMLDAGVTIGLGTDGAASAGSLDMQESARLAALLAKGMTQDPTRLPAMDVIAMGTREAAIAVGEANLGVIAPGMRADLQLVSLDRFAAAPDHDPASRVVYSASQADVRHVMIGGKVVLRDRQLTTIDGDAARRALARAADIARGAVEQSARDSR